MAELKNKSELIGKTDYDLIWRDIADELHAIDQYVIEHGYYEVEEYPTINGKKHVFLTIKKSLLNNKNEVIGIIGLSTDITEKKDAEKLKVENAIHKVATQEHEKFKQVVKQMAHDINSPIIGLRSLAECPNSEIPEDQRIALRIATMKIVDSTNHMLTKYEDINAETEEREPLLVSVTLLQTISEKRYEYKNSKVQFVYDDSLKVKSFDAKRNDFVFIQAVPLHFKRMISNLINNAVDALEGKPDGVVTICLDSTNEWVMITIDDNGKGMSADIVKKLEKRIAFTAGKKNGHGIGFTQIHDTIESNFGKLEISSSENEGTSMILRFPRIQNPNWVVDTVKINKDDIIVVLDDDKSIHDVWDSRFIPIIEKTPTLEFKHFSDGEETISFINGLSDKDKNRVCLLSDFELLKQKVNGIDVINQTKVKRSILVTSHHDEHKIRDAVIRTGIKLLPKSLALNVPIKIDKKLKPHSKKVDMVWLDDEKYAVDRLINTYYKHLKIDFYNDPITFLEDVIQYPLDTTIILDNYYYEYDLMCHLDGRMVAEKLHNQGYTKLILVSGEVMYSPPPYLTIILKQDLEKLSNLNKI